jgi:hypothetical protein
MGTVTLCAAGRVDRGAERNLARVVGRYRRHELPLREPSGCARRHEADDDGDDDDEAASTDGHSSLRKERGFESRADL